MKQDAPKITVVGSSNMDLVVKSERIPVTGETILGGDFVMVPGGKGANQAVAAAKLGAEVYFIAKLGDDIFGTQSLSNFKKEGVNTTYVTQTKEAPSGVALITIDDNGNNIIVVAPGANGTLSPDDVRAAKTDIASSGALVAQLEVPIETIEFAAKMAHKHNVPFILDPAPARQLSAELLGMVSILTPNETEARILTGIEVKDENSAVAAAKKLLEFGIKVVILTMGTSGFLLATSGETRFVPAKKVNAVDSTAAGDVFTGSLASGLAAGKTLLDAALFANHAAALSVTKIGAQSSIPTLEQVKEFMND
ncbi:MAG: ribokinase [Planctomycetota bacterium]|jgi:ribokinase